NKVLRWYVDNGYTAVPVNPKEKTIESLPCVQNLSSLPGTPSEYHVSIITPPSVTKSVLEEAHKNGIKRVWMQPDVDSPEALAYAKEVGIQVIARGPCVLVDGFSSSRAKL
ncbi:CoA-binding protein, partial [Dissophora ornata]